MSTTWTLQIFDRSRFVPISGALEVGSGRDEAPWAGWEWHSEDAGPDGWEGYITNSPELALRMIDAMISAGRSSRYWIEMWRAELGHLIATGVPLRFVASCI